MAKYFDKFPLVSYSNNVAKNIIARVDFTSKTRNDINANFDYVLTDGLSRPDMVSQAYYNSPWYDWVLYINNNVMDPYYDYYVSEENLNEYIISKYGSLESARRRIVHYRNNWAIDDGTIDISVYDNLSGKLKKYYKPNISITNQVLNYSRIQEDWIRTTNKVIELTMDPTYISNYIVNDIILQTSTDAKATVKQIIPDKNIMIVHHVVGEFDTSAAILSINTGPTEEYLDTDGTYKNKKLWETITTDEAAFWEPVTAYDYETEQNAIKKYITIIKSDYILDIDKMLSNELAG
jgi:hypothetical protein